MLAANQVGWKVTLSELLKAIVNIAPEDEREIQGISADSRTITPGDLFVAVKGQAYDGRNFIKDAIAQGAVAVLCEMDENVPVICREQFNDAQVPIIAVRELASQIGYIAARFYGQPTQRLSLIGITGTNGKTSCSHFIAQALQNLGQACGIIGTLGYGFPGHLIPSCYTTPDAITLQRELADLHGQGAKAVALEVSSHSLIQHRVAGANFTVGIFTNLTREHLDYHGTMDRYAYAKSLLFHQASLRYGIINLDDPFGVELVKQFRHQLQLYGYSINNVATDIPTIHAKDICFENQGFSATLTSPWGEGRIQTQLLGRFNISNVLAAFTALNVLDVPFNKALSSLNSLTRVPGRMQVLGGGKLPTVVVDFAHTPDALEQVLLALREHCKGKLWCVFGCGGDRDRGKRPIMGKVAEQYSDRIIITNDNPRTENSQQIAANIIEGLAFPWAAEVLHDRQAAIAHAIDCTDSGDIVLIAGKGHEQYQIIDKEKFPFNDVEQAQLQLRLKRKLSNSAKGESA